MAWKSHHKEGTRTNDLVVRDMWCSLYGRSILPLEFWPLLWKHQTLKVTPRKKPQKMWQLDTPWHPQDCEGAIIVRKLQIRRMRPLHSSDPQAKPPTMAHHNITMLPTALPIIPMISIASFGTRKGVPSGLLEEWTTRGQPPKISQPLRTAQISLQTTKRVVSSGHNVVEFLVKNTP